MAYGHLFFYSIKYWFILLFHTQSHGDLYDEGNCDPITSYFNQLHQFFVLSNDLRQEMLFRCDAYVKTSSLGCPVSPRLFLSLLEIVVRVWIWKLGFFILMIMEGGMEGYAK